MVLTEQWWGWGVVRAQDRACAAPANGRRPWTTPDTGWTSPNPHSRPSLRSAQSEPPTPKGPPERFSRGGVLFTRHFVRHHDASAWR
jgi:hypothetical protein